MYKTLRVPQRERRYFKEIAWLLLIKLCLIIAIRIIFFSSPESKPDGVTSTAAHLLGVSVPESRAPSPDNRSHHDQ